MHAAPSRGGACARQARRAAAGNNRGRGAAVVPITEQEVLHWQKIEKQNKCFHIFSLYFSPRFPNTVISASNVSNSIKGLRRAGAAGASRMTEGGAPTLGSAEPAPRGAAPSRGKAAPSRAEPARSIGGAARGRRGACARQGRSAQGRSAPRVGAPPSALSAFIYAIGLSHCISGQTKRGEGSAPLSLGGYRKSLPHRRFAPKTL